MLKKSQIALYAMLLTLFALQVALLTTAALSNVPSGDDYAFASITRNGNLTDLFIEFSRYTARIFNLIILGATYDLVTIHLVSKVGGFINIAAMIFLIYANIRSYLLPKKIVIPLLMGLILSTLSIISSQAIHENTYWYPGIVTYSLPVIALLAYFSVRKKIFQASNKYIHGLLLIIFFLMSTINEIFTLQIILLWTLLILYRTCVKLKISRQIIYEYLGMVAGTIFLISAPASRKRSALYMSLDPNRLISIEEKVKFILSSSIENYIKFIQDNYYLLFIAFMAGILIAAAMSPKPKIGTKKNILLLGASILIGYLGFFCTSFIFGVAGTRIITNYSFYTANVSTLLSFTLIGLSIALIIKKDILLKFQPYILVLILIGSLRAELTTRSLNIQRLMVLQNLENRSMTAQIEKQKSRGEKDIRLNKTTKYFTYCVPVKSKEAWCNIAASKYFEVNSIGVSEYNEIYDYNKLPTESINN